jgi:hypothetical protein
MKKKRKCPLRGSHIHTKKTGRNEDEVTDNLPPSKEAPSRVKLKKQEVKDLPMYGGEIHRKVNVLCPLSRLVFLIH